MEGHTKTKIARREFAGVTLIPKDGYYQVRKIGLTADRVKKDPKFHKTRQRAKEFGRAAALSKSITDKLEEASKSIDNKQAFTGLVLKAIKRDEYKEMGTRNVVLGDKQILATFNFNSQCSWQDMVSVPHSWNGRVLRWPPHTPLYAINAPEGITHYRFKAAIVSIDKEGEVRFSGWKQSSRFPCKALVVPETKIEWTAAVDNNSVQLLVMYLKWYSTAIKRRQEEPMIIMEVR